ncbi:MAG: MlaD family protein [Bythopirellula sp.]|nr:MlaD family protein [Bythopirellula sp.]
MAEQPSSSQSNPEFPTARVADVPHPARVAGKLASRVWNVTALCFLVAFGLVWAGLHSGGSHIEITFTDGNGLVPGDKVRYRGIDVGEVVSVVLGDNLDKVTVTAELTAESAPLAREGTRFWIEKPDIRLGQVRGLDTLLSGRYVGVLPGPANSPRATIFEGLADPPASVEDLSDGLEVVLESAQRFGLQRGSPVSYRGVDIGHVISVGLTSDSSNVVARTFIRPEYRSLIRDNTRFWSNSGIDLRFGFQGFEFDAETLATIAAGGVALATPDSLGQRVSTGHRFELTKSPRDEWLKWQPRLAIGSASLPDDFVFPQPTLAVSQGESSLAVFGHNRRRGWLLALESGAVLGPADLLAFDKDDERTLEIWGATIPLVAEGVTTSGGLATRTIPGEQVKAESLWPLAKIQVDANLGQDFQQLIVTCGSDNLTMPLATDRLTAVEGRWQVDPLLPLDETWHGASVLSATEGKLLGIVLSTEEGMVIEGIKQELLRPHATQ